MAALYIIAGTAALFIILLSFNASLYIAFDSSAADEMNVYAKIGFYKIYISPEKKKKPRKVKRTPKITASDKEKAAPEKKENKEKKKYSVPEIFALIKDIGAALLIRCQKHLKVRIYGLDVIIAAGEAEKTAVLYGAAAGAAHCLFEFLSQNFKIHTKYKNIKIVPDFLKTECEFHVSVKFYMRLSHILGLLIASALKYLKFAKTPKQTN